MVPMDNSEIKQKILKDLGEEQNHTDARALMDKLSRKYDVSEEVLEQVIAEWSAGREKVGGEDEGTNK